MTAPVEVHDPSANPGGIFGSILLVAAIALVIILALGSNFVRLAVGVFRVD